MFWGTRLKLGRLAGRLCLRVTEFILSERHVDCSVMNYFLKRKKKNRVGRRQGVNAPEKGVNV